MTKLKLSSQAKALLEGPEYAVGAAYLGDRQQITAAEDALLFLGRPLRLQLLGDVANLRDGDDAVKGFWLKWRRRIAPELTHELFALRDQLRTVWLGRNDFRADDILNEWLNWRPSDLFKRTNFSRPKMPFSCSVEAARLIPATGSIRAMLIQGVFEHSRHFKFCANKDCMTPYFIAKRSDQSVCDAGICKAEKQREHARKWWNKKRANKGSKQKKGR